MNGFPKDRTFYYYRGRVAFYALLRALALESGDEVLIPGFTCIAVPSPILGMGARPVYVDIDPNSYNLDPRKLEELITPRSRVIVAQHTYGIPCDMDGIMAVARKHGLAVIEDACHVWGSTYGGRDIGTIGVAAFYSYDPGKPFIIGMGGAAVVNDEGLSEQVRRLYGDLKSPGVAETMLLNLQYLAHRLTRQPQLFWVVRDFYRFLSRKGVAVATWSSNDFQGKLGPDYSKRLPRLLQTRLLAMMQRGEEVIARHQRLSQRYERGLRELGVPEIQRDPRATTVMICCPLQVMNKPGLLAEARRNKVELGDWFRSPVHPLEESAWQAVGYEKGRCPVAEAVTRRVVSLPCHAGVTQGEADRTLAFLAEMKTRGLFIPAPVPREGEATTPPSRADAQAGL